MQAQKSGESIEGLKIQGYSRDPIRSKPTKKINGIRYFRVKAEFDVFAEIVSVLAKGTVPIDANALTTIDDTLRSDTASITIIAKTRNLHFSQKLESRVSHRHGAHKWEFKDHTNVKVDTHCEEIVNALEKRKHEMALT
jgi:hypothetical protein